MDRPNQILILGGFLFLFGLGFLCMFLIDYLIVGRPEKFSCIVTKTNAFIKICYDFDPNTRPQSWTGEVFFFFSRKGTIIDGSMQGACGQTLNSTVQRLHSFGYEEGAVFECWYNPGYYPDPRRGILWFGRKGPNIVYFWIGAAIIFLACSMILLGIYVPVCMNKRALPSEKREEISLIPRKEDEQAKLFEEFDY